MSKNGINQLPKRASTHKNEDDSRRKFTELFSDPHFICRQENESDYGVDCIIEALVDGGDSPSNMRTHVQLKSTSADLNQDGSISYSVDVSNLSYLLSVANSFYAIHHQKSGNIYWRYAQDIYAEATGRGKNWSEATVTVRCNDILDSNAVGSIHQAVVAHGSNTKRIRLRAPSNAAAIDSRATFAAARTGLTFCGSIRGTRRSTPGCSTTTSPH